MKEHPPHQTTPDLAGQPFGNYLILRRLGSGGMADVYLAVQKSLDRQVAIKVLKPQLAADDSYVRRLHNEAKSVAALTHQNIVQVFEVGHVDGHHYIAQEYVAGRNLKQQLQRTPSLPVAEAVSVLLAVTSALGRSSDMGIVHRDIKPENILLGDDGEVKVADFGLARKGRDHGELELTQVGMTVGTPLYMSPEQIRGGRISALTDMYSLGVTAYHMLAGYPPFDADTPLNVAMKHVNEEPPTLVEVRPDVPLELSQIVARMMAKEPEHRFGGFDELHTRLSRLDPAPEKPVTLINRAPTRSGESRPLMPATRELAAVIGDRPSTTRSSTTRSPMGPWLAAAAMLGALVALFGGRVDPLAPRAGESVPQIERKESAQAQYRYAMFLNTEEAWTSLLEYFPPDGDNGGPRQRYHALNAKRQLARWYFDNDRAGDAIPICEELAALDATDESLKAYGLAGLAIAHYRRGEMEQAASKLSSLSEYRDAVDRAMGAELARIDRALRSD